jgi:hypothetical protein
VRALSREPGGARVRSVLDFCGSHGDHMDELISILQKVDLAYTAIINGVAGAFRFDTWKSILLSFGVFFAMLKPIEIHTVNNTLCLNDSRCHSLAVTTILVSRRDWNANLSYPGHEVSVCTPVYQSSQL